MPGKNGRQLVESVRPFYPKLRVLYMTGYTRNAIVHNGRLDPGVDLFDDCLFVGDAAIETLRG